LTLGRLILAWLPVAVWLALAAYGRRRLGAADQAPSPPEASGLLAAEAGVVTLIASLWFDSLGHGGWWLLFLLFGLLVAIPATPPAETRRARLARIAFDCARYVVAGLILSWRLG
jgi:hypothetical protein